MYAKDIWDSQIKVTLYTAKRCKYSTCCASTHRTHTVYIRTHSWRRPAKCALKDCTLTICILWGFHSHNIESTTEQTCLVSPRMKPIVTFFSSQIYVILWDPTYTTQQTIMRHLWESYVQEKTREPSMEGQLWQRRTVVIWTSSCLYRQSMQNYLLAAVTNDLIQPPQWTRWVCMRRWGGGLHECHMCTLAVWCLTLHCTSTPYSGGAHSQQHSYKQWQGESDMCLECVSYMRDWQPITLVCCFHTHT